MMYKSQILKLTRMTGFVVQGHILTSNVQVKIFFFLHYYFLM